MTNEKIERKNLAFIEKLLEENNMSKRGLARRLNRTFQNIFEYFRKDDMKLSYVEQVGAAMGYTLTFTFKNPNKKVDTEKILYNVSDLIVGEDVGRLAFLKVAMAIFDVSRKDLSEATGLHYTAINRWFRVDDIHISYLYQIADAFGWTLEIKATKKTPEEIIL